MNLAHDVNQPLEMIDLLPPFLLGFRQANGDPGITTGHYPLAALQPGGTVDWTSAFEPAVTRKWLQHLSAVGFPMTGSPQIFATIEVVSTAAHVAPGRMVEYIRGARLSALETEVDIEREVPALLPPQREYTRVFRVKHLGHAEPLISSDDMVSAYEF